MGRGDREEAIDEARMLSQLAHPHVVRHYSSFISEYQLGTVTESSVAYMRRGTPHCLLLVGVDSALRLGYSLCRASA
jgi:hypothetical protein